MATPEMTAEQQALQGINADYTERYGFHDAENYLFKVPKGLTRELVEQISAFKNEPQWMREFRLKALEHFLARPMPTWGSPHLAEVDFDDIHYFVRASERAERSWNDVPEDVKKTFDRLGIPEAERKFLAGVGAQYESEVVYHQVRKDLEIGIFNCNGEILAIEDRCSHDDGNLADGEFDPQRCTVECPRHGSRFDLRTGKPLTLPAYVPVDTFPVSVADGVIKLEVD